MKGKYYKKAIQLLALSMMLASCGKDDVIPREQPSPKKEQQEAQERGKQASISLEGDWSDGLRGLFLELKNGIPQFKLEVKDYPIKLYVRKLTHTTITTIDAKAQYSVLASGERHFKVKVDNFTLQGAGEAFAVGDNDWYVCGIIGEAPATIADQKVMNPIGEERKLPLGFPWTKLTISSNGLGEHRQLRFNLIGNLLKVGLRNNIISAVEVSSIRLRSAGVAFAGSFSPESVTDANLTNGDYMSFKSSTANQDFDISTLINGASIRVASGEERMLQDAYIWTYPIDKRGGIQAQMQVLTRPRGMTNEEFAKSSLPIKERKTFTTYSLPATLHAPSDGYLHSKVHKAPFMVTSDLMITEEYHFNIAQLNTSIIELHNPTLDPIELKHYGLMKVGEDLAHGPDGVAFFPQNDQTSAERFVNTAATGAYQEARTHQALIMPLDLVTGEAADATWAYWRWRTYVPNQRDGNEPNKTRYYAHTLKVKTIRSGAANGDGVRDVIFHAPPQNPVLDPGKTMLILGPGYIEYTPDENGYGILYPTKSGPLQSGGAAQRGQLGPGLQPLESYRLGYCQYVFAMADYSVSSANSRNDASSTNHLDADQGVVLVKQRQNGSLPQRKIIDASMPYNNAGSSLSDVRAFRTTATDAHSRVRCDGDYFPSTVYRAGNWHGEDMNWSNRTRTQWASREYYTNRMTLGTRWFVQDGSKAKQSQWGDSFKAPTKSW